MKPSHFSHAVPFLPVKDLKETIQYYKEQLGFYEEWFWEDSDAGIRRDDLRLLFNRNPEHLSQINSSSQTLEICWFVTNVNEIYEEYKGKEIKIIKELWDAPWGMREFSILEINGYVIRNW
ncbi:MAG TPA: VOC family protein [Chitinophagales bacterium]|nr:VOC family protein [Chitinophagales bacterium]